MTTILVIDDDKNSLAALSCALKKFDFSIFEAQSAPKAKEILNVRDVDVVVSDVVMGETSGLDLVDYITENFPNIKCILVTAFGTIEMAVDAIKRGAYDYITKPINIDKLKISIDRAIKTKELEKRVLELEEQVSEKYSFKNIIGKSKIIQDIFDRIEKIAPTDATVLISGESGVGKELVAKDIHFNSKRVKFPFVTVNCAAIIPTLFESELFGHERGAFTGAIKTKVGKFEFARRGTLFLDEIGDLPLTVQPKLLRVLEANEIERVGGTATIECDVRLIAATNKNLKDEIDKGRFREDLYHRLSVVSLHIPPIRERVEDIPYLVDYFVSYFSKHHNKNIKKVTRETIEMLQLYHWSGNVRELKNILESIVILTNSDTITPRDLPSHFSKELPKSVKFDHGLSLDEIEKEVILETLKRTNNNKVKTSEILKIGLKTLYRRLEDYGIKD